MVDPTLWDAALDVENSSSCGSEIVWYVVIPLNPRIHPVKVFVVIPVYVIISSSILNNPYFSGNPFVLTTEITALSELMESVMEVDPTIISGVRLSSFKYWSKFSATSTGPPWYSWEI